MLALLASEQVGWPDVFIALIAGLPAIIAALTTIHVRRLLKTPSGAPIGKQVEDTQQVALANHYALLRHGIERRKGVRPPDEQKPQPEQPSDQQP